MNNAASSKNKGLHSVIEGTDIPTTAFVMINAKERGKWHGSRMEAIPARLRS
jgi:hypothetical protein